MATDQLKEKNIKKIMFKTTMGKVIKVEQAKK